VDLAGRTWKIHSWFHLDVVSYLGVFQSLQQTTEKWFVTLQINLTAQSQRLDGLTHLSIYIELRDRKNAHVFLARKKQNQHSVLVAVGCDHGREKR